MAEPDKKEFIRISQAVGIGFLIMGWSSISWYQCLLRHITNGTQASSDTLSSLSTSP